ncbi:MAG: 5'-nucleotidase C-terminal domain-containing protein [Anaerolineae bacterium]|jgi:5'-nucleotidase
MRRKKMTHLLLITMLLSLLLTVAPSAAVAKGPPDKPPKVDVWLTVLHNNDGESQLIDLGAGLEDFGGAARFKTLVDDLKWEATHGPRYPGQRGAKRGVVMVSSGDNFLAGPEFNASLDKGVPFYDTIAMDLIGYDAVAIGNHDFDFGPDVLADFIEGYSYTSPPYLSANLDYSGEPRLQALFDAGRIARSVVVKERGEYIGIIGATTPNLPFISSPRNVGVDPDVSGAIQAEVDKLEMMGVNKIILITHLQSIEEDLALAPTLDGVDVMVAGGGDEVLANAGDLLIPGHEAMMYGPYPMTATDIDGTEVPVVTTAGSYGYAGRLVVGFDKDGNVIDIGDNSGPVRVAGGDNPDAVMPDPWVQTMVVDPVVAYLEDLATNVIGTSAVALDGIKPHVRTEETNEGDLIADALKWQAEQLAGDFGVTVPDIALQNGGGIRNDSIIPAGDITELDTYDMLPFPNFVTVIEDIPPDQFKEIMENAVSRVEFTDGRFAQVSGFTLVWDALGTPQVLDDDGNVVTPGTRVVEIELDDGTDIVQGGVVVAGAPDVTIATIDFLARGGDKYPYRGAPFTSVGVSYQQALANYIVGGLDGVIAAGDYPEGGEGRITRLN